MKKKKISLLLVGLLMIGLLAGCSISGNAQTDTTADSVLLLSSSQSADAVSVAASTITTKLKDADTDSTWDAAQATYITLSGATATVSGSGATVSGGTVTITAAGTYVLSGTLSKGQILIDATKDDLVRLVLNGVDITADTNAAIYAAVADKLVIILAEGTTNTITDGATYLYADAEKEEPNAALFSKCDLSINGTGSLTVNGNFNHGIATKDDLVIASGEITVSAVNNAIRGKDSITILGGTFRLTSTDGDGIKSANDTEADKGWILIQGGTFDITAKNDGIQAYTILEIQGGSFTITTGGGYPGSSITTESRGMNMRGMASFANTTTSTVSNKAIKSGGDMVIGGGVFSLSAYEDTVHSNANITINGGTLSMQSGDDGIHADGTVTINGGIIDIKNSYEGIEGASINLLGGIVNVYASDDAVNVNNASGLLTIAGGEIYLNANGDGLDSNGSVVMTGGTVYVDGPVSSANGAIDYDRQFTISGGTLVAVDGGNMSEAPGTASSQPSIVLYLTSGQSAGTVLSVQSADGNTLVSYTSQKDYRVAVISTAEMTLGASYTIYSNNTRLCDVTLSSSLTAIDSSGASVAGGMTGGQRNMGGMGGGRQGTPGGFGK